MTDYTNHPSKQKIIYLRYLGLVKTDDNNSLSQNTDNHENRDSIKRKIKQNIGNIISQRLDSVSSVYIPQLQKSSSNTVGKGVKIGKSGGRLSNRSEYLFEYEIQVETIVDSHTDSTIDEVWLDVKNALSDSQFDFSRNITVNGRVMDVNSHKGTIHLDSPVDEPKYSIDSGEKLTSNVPEDIHQKGHIENEIANYSNSAYPHISESDKNLDGYDIDNQINAIKDQYQDKSVRIKKPTKKEFNQILDSIVDRIIEIGMDDYVYLEDVPEFWNKCECSKCKEKDDNFYAHFRDNARNVMIEQLREGFGISEEENRRELVSSEITNFYISDTGQVYFRPEELISWIIDYSHYVEPYCEDCHSEIGGGNHNDIIRVSKTKEISDNIQVMKNNNKDKTDIQREISDNTPEIKNDADKITINPEVIEETDNWSYYRTPTKNEYDEIIDRIFNHLRNLGTRNGSTKYKSQRKDIYHTILKRKYATEGIKSKNIECVGCECELNHNGSNLNRHHSEPVSLKAAHQEIMKAIKLPPEQSPIIVNNNTNHYIIGDKFLWRLESLIENIDIKAYICERCKDSKWIQDTQSEVIQTKITDSTDGHLNVSKSDIRKYINSYNKTNEYEIEYICVHTGEEYIARYNNGSYIVRGTNKNIPVINGYQLNRPDVEYFGISPESKNMLVQLINSKKPFNSEEEINQALINSLQELI